jgi:protein SCO1/2
MRCRARPGGVAGRLLGGVLAALVLAAAAPAADVAPRTTGRPAVVRDVGLDQRIGERLPLGTRFRDSSGRDVALGDFFGERPVLLVPAYYECPMLCTLVLNGVLRALRALTFEPARDFDVVTFSFDPDETSAMAAAKQATYLAEYRRPGAAAGWHFLTGDAGAIRRLTRAIGYRYVYDEESGEYAHPSGVVVATPDGRVSHYFFGVEFSPRDLRLAFVEASARRLGSVADQLLLLCFRYDPTLGAYSAAAMRALRVAGVLTLGALAAFVWWSARRPPPPLGGAPAEAEGPA